jgi:hypothetical protein
VAEVGKFLHASSQIMPSQVQRSGHVDAELKESHRTWHVLLPQKQADGGQLSADSKASQGKWMYENFDSEMPHTAQAASLFA